MVDHHPDDEFHPADPSDPFWTETCWFTFTVPERRLSGQFYPFFRTTQGVLSAGAYFWDHTGRTPADILHARHFWHLPIPDQPLSDIQLPNGIAYRCVEPLHRYEVSYRDPDGDGDGGRGRSGHQRGPHLHRHRPPQLSGPDPPGPARPLPGHPHPGRGGARRGRLRVPRPVLGPRSQFGYGIHGTPARCGGYSYATASDADGFHAITMDFSGGFGDGSTAIHGYVLRDGTWSKVASGRRTVLARDPGTAYPVAVAVDLADELGRALHAEGRCLNGLGLFLNPNLYSVNCLTEWTFDGTTAYGEDHDNWSATGIREFLRSGAGD